ncbi:hypothetical protein N8I77_013107 [Diaporthe amygdali]|uniref:Uncharacterized protein n=1 Tax=Phomopsis amygdali TaxID=1214568 RepID=A0AAD9VZF0_PHOAM|nr:hypothetical protein N8I77_013107 [Diaporthe amygdali]
MILLPLMLTMALFSSLPLSVILAGLFLAWLADAQTVYVTQTVFTACECSESSSQSSLLSFDIPVGSIEALQDLTANQTKPLTIPTGTPGTASTPAVVSILGGSTPVVVVPSLWTSTLTGTFPSPGAPSSAAPAPVSLSIVSSPWSGTLSSLLSNPPVSTSAVPTVASAISLSGGLGPLLSSSISKALTGASVISSLVPGTDTSIEVISSMIAPTAASSALTTSGIPEALPANLSLDSAEMSLASSAALISFGTSSPAVISTILPSSLTLGTSSRILTTYSTVALNGLSLTSVTVLVPRSPTSCYALPTPSASMDLVAVAVTPEDTVDLTNPMILSFGENATNPRYIGAFASGESYILDLSPDNPIIGQLGLQIPGDNALVFEGSGMSLYKGNCSLLSEVLVDNFYSQVGAIGGAGAKHASAVMVEKRQDALNSSTFTVDISVDNYLNTPDFSPSLSFGNSLCTVVSNAMGRTVDNITWSCLYPPPEGGASACAARLSTWLSDINSPSTAPQNTTEVLATLSPFLALAGDSLTELFPGADPALGLGFAFMRQVENAVKEAVGDVGAAACNVMHGFDSDDLVIEDSGPLGTKTLGSFITAPPPSLAINLAASATASIVELPRRKANPTDNFLLQIATDFKSLFAPFNSWLHGLPTLGIFGIEETGMVHIPMPTTTYALTATASTTTMASAHGMAHIEVPTLTVTHVLGEGWFSPSTYVVGPGTTPSLGFPAFDMHRFASDISSSVTSPSLASSSSANIIDNIAAHLAAMDGDPGVRAGWHADWPSQLLNQGGTTTTTGAAMGYDGHIVLVTTTVTEWMGSGDD